MREVQPFVPLAAGQTVGTAAFSYDGGVMLGLSADRDSTTDLGVLAFGIAEGVEELVGLVRTTTPITK